MKNLKNKFYILCSCSTILLLCSTACHKDKDQVIPVDNSVSADFTISELLFGTDRIFQTDTIINNDGQFTAKNNADSYLWKIGGRTYNTKSVTIRFTNSTIGLYDVATLIAYKNGKTDTVKKPFNVYVAKGTTQATLYPNFAISPVYIGVFKGSYEDAPSYQFNVTIANLGVTPPPGAGWYGFRIYNLPEGCGGQYTSGQNCVFTTVAPDKYAYSFEYSYKAFFVNSGDAASCCPPVRLHGYLDSTNRNKVIVEYEQYNSAQTQIILKRKFIGTRQ